MHAHCDLCAECARVKLQGLLAAAVEEEVGLNQHGASHSWTGQAGIKIHRTMSQITDERSTGTILVKILLLRSAHESAVDEAATEIPSSAGEGREPAGRSSLS
jgi:hypothetical protein